MIKSKKESDAEIKRLNLNRMAEGIFRKGEEDKLIDFLLKNPYEYYNIRDKSKSMGHFIYKARGWNVPYLSRNYEKFSVYESLALADEQLVLQGEIQISKSFEVIASLSNIKGISNRDAMKTPVYKIYIDLKENREPEIPGLTQIIDYAVHHRLFDVVIEFSLFEVLVGVNKENIIIWELRNY